MSWIRVCAAGVGKVNILSFSPPSRLTPPAGADCSGILCPNSCNGRGDCVPGTNGITGVDTHLVISKVSYRRSLLVQCGLDRLRLRNPVGYALVNTVTQDLHQRWFSEADTGQSICAYRDKPDRPQETSLSCRMARFCQAPTGRRPGKAMCIRCSTCPRSRTSRSVHTHTNTVALIAADLH